MTSIGDYAFRACRRLTSIEIPDSVTSIGNYAFGYCSNLTSIEIPNSVLSIGEVAFYECDSLTSIEIPASVTSIGNYVFTNCSGLTSIVVDEGNTVYTSAGSNCIIEKSSNTLIAGCRETIIPNSVTSIGDSAFSGCESLTSIEISTGVTSIGDKAFYDCSGLTSIEIPDSVTSIGGYAFRGCSSLTSIEIPDSVIKIGFYAFTDCSNLTSIEIPNSVTIYCSADSYARQYAIDNNIPYKSLDEWGKTTCTHANTELRNAVSATCTKAGYTGDTYCKDCGELVSKGKSIAALGHSYKASVTKQPTVDAEGVRTYTCSRCKTSYTEKIAKLTVTYTVKFDGNGADSGSVANQKMTYGSKTALNVKKFQKKGYTFKGWNTKKDGSGTTYANKADGSKLTKTNGATVTLYAQWTANKYTITFNGNGSTSGSMKKLSGCKYGKKYTLTKNGFKKKGYTFAGWYSDKKCTKKVTQIKKGSTGNITLYAKWKKK